MSAAAGVGVGIGISGAVFAQPAGDVTVIGFGGEVAGWAGRQPASIEGQTNPTLNLVEGKRYVVVWENLDGQPHNFQIRGEGDEPIPALVPLQNNTTADNVAAGEYMDGNLTLSNETVSNVTMTTEEGAEPAIQPIDTTETVATQGAIQTLSFTATSEMTSYICVIHPTTMVGDISVGEEGL